MFRNKSSLNYQYLTKMLVARFKLHTSKEFTISLNLIFLSRILANRAGSLSNVSIL